MNTYQEKKSFKIVCISDTHGCFPDSMQSGDILIHAGDISYYGKKDSFYRFFKWMDSLDFRYKIVIGGNHDLVLDQLNYPKILSKKDSDEFPYLASPQVATMIKEKYIYLENNSVNIEGLNIWGSPYTLGYYGRAFGCDEKLSKQIYSKIPLNTHIVVTHQPPHGYGDVILSGKHVGDIELSKKIFEIKPLLHVFGHIHESYGTYIENGIMFLNSSYTSLTAESNPPHIINIEI